MNYLGAYTEGAFRAAIASCFINGRISEQQIDFVKEAISKFRETEIENLAIPFSKKEEMKRQWKQWLDATAHGIKDELRAEGKLG
jgi:hypothetical protein